MNKFFVRFFVIILCLTASLLPFSLFGCEKKKDLSDHVSSLRLNEYYGKSDEFEMKCAYGFSTVNGERVYTLSFKLLNSGTDEAKRELFFNLGDMHYNSVLSLNPVSNCKTTTVEITGEPQNEFTVTLKTGAEEKKVSLVSVIPEGTLSYVDALNFLEQNQGSLLSHYKSEDGNFAGHISMRVFVKDNKAFWYVCLTDENGLNKALLVDGNTGEILAVRNII